MPVDKALLPEIDVRLRKKILLTWIMKWKIILHMALTNRTPTTIILSVSGIEHINTYRLFKYNDTLISYVWITFLGSLDW